LADSDRLTTEQQHVSQASKQMNYKIQELRANLLTVISFPVNENLPYFDTFTTCSQCIFHTFTTATIHLFNQGLINKVGRAASFIIPCTLIKVANDISQCQEILVYNSMSNNLCSLMIFGYTAQ